jgi:hypothetical protein
MYHNRDYSKETFYRREETYYTEKRPTAVGGVKMLEVSHLTGSGTCINSLSLCSGACTFKGLGHRRNLLHTKETY